MPKVPPRRQFDLNCKNNVALKFTWKIVALFTKNYPSRQTNGKIKADKKGKSFLYLLQESK